MKITPDVLELATNGDDERCRSDDFLSSIIITIRAVPEEYSQELVTDSEELMEVTCIVHRCWSLHQNQKSTSSARVLEWMVDARVLIESSDLSSTVEEAVEWLIFVVEPVLNLCIRSISRDVSSSSLFSSNKTRIE